MIFSLVLVRLDPGANLTLATIGKKVFFAVQVHKFFNTVRLVFALNL